MSLHVYVWEDLARGLMGNGINPDWNWTVQRLQHMELQGLDLALARLLFQVAVYNVWRENNARQHQQVWTSKDQMRKPLIRPRTESSRLSTYQITDLHDYFDDGYKSQFNR